MSNTNTSSHLWRLPGKTEGGVVRRFTFQRQWLADAEETETRSPGKQKKKKNNNSATLKVKQCHIHIYKVVALG